MGLSYIFRKCEKILTLGHATENIGKNMNLSINHKAVVMHAGRLAVLMLSCWLLGQTAYAAEMLVANSSASQPSAKRFGVVWRIKGEVLANVAGTSRPLQEGSPVYVGEHVRAAASGEAVIKTDDAGLIAVRPGAEFVAVRFVADGKKTDNLSLRLISGSLRVITGWIGKLNAPGHRIYTPNATIGIRGTDHEPYVLSADLAAASQY